jgi:hypothetical protein
MIDPVIGGGAVAKILLGIGAVGGSIWLAYERWLNSKLKSANNDAGVAVADAQQTVYTMMTARLESLDKEVTELRRMVEQERHHRMLLEKHVWKLENMLHKAGVEPPVLEIAKL